MTTKTQYNEIAPFITKDSAIIRELMHPDTHHQLGSRSQSLAEARIAIGVKTHLHCHHLSEGLYHVTAGCGEMTLGDEQFEVSVGDTVCIPPTTPHCVENIGTIELVILCCCSPAYQHDDTELLTTIV